MGWTYHEKPANVSEWFKNHLTWEGEKKRYTCLKTAVKFKEAYAAVECFDKETGNSYVFAVAYMLNYTREHYYNFGYKSMDETYGPNISNCPASILNMLSPVEDMPWGDETKGWAAAWRERCWKKANMKKIGFGDKIEFENDVLGVHGRVWEKVRYGRKRNVFRSVTDGTLFTLTRNYLNAYGHKVL